jgi:hypothetical protein
MGTSPNYEELLFHRVLLNKNISHVLMSYEHDAIFFNDVYGKVSWLPHTYTWDTYHVINSIKNVMVPGNLRGRKNGLLPIYALSKYKNIRVCLSFVEQNLKSFIPLIHTNIQILGNMSRGEYEDFLFKNIDLGINLSLSETYSYATMEMFAKGIPSLVSNIIPVAEDNDMIKTYLLVEDVQNIYEIRDKIETLIKNPDVLTQLSHIVRTQYEKINTKHIGLVKEKVLPLL